MPDNTNLLDDPANLETVVNEPIPTLYIDGFWGAAINDGVVKLKLASTLVVEFSGGSAVSDCGAVEVAIGPVG